MISLEWAFTGTRLELRADSEVWATVSETAKGRFHAHIAKFSGGLRDTEFASRYEALRHVRAWYDQVPGLSVRWVQAVDEAGLWRAVYLPDAGDEPRDRAQELPFIATADHHEGITCLVPETGFQAIRGLVVLDPTSWTYVVPLERKSEALEALTRASRLS